MIYFQRDCSRRIFIKNFSSLPPLTSDDNRHSMPAPNSEKLGVANHAYACFAFFDDSSRWRKIVAVNTVGCLRDPLPLSIPSLIPVVDRFGTRPRSPCAPSLSLPPFLAPAVSGRRFSERSMKVANSLPLCQELFSVSAFISGFRFSSSAVSQKLFKHLSWREKQLTGIRL